jgi:Na+-transporting methylmalonyl-CoA/oxaloacetate decarboxylase gamma subunit
MIFAAADLTWAEASIAIAGIAFVTIVASVLIWQIFATGRTGLSAKRENAYQKLAEASAGAQNRTAAVLEKTAAELADLRERTAGLERLLKDVE